MLFKAFVTVSPAEEPGPHVEPVLEADAGDGHLVGPERLLPGQVLIGGAPLMLHLLQHALQEGSEDKYLIVNQTNEKLKLS